MPELNNVEQLRNWFRTCPAILDSNRFRIDYLDKDPTEYAIYAVPSTMTYRENVLGEEVPADIQTLNFIFASKESLDLSIVPTLTAYPAEIGSDAAKYQIQLRMTYKRSV